MNLIINGFVHLKKKYFTYFFPDRLFMIIIPTQTTYILKLMNNSGREQVLFMECSESV